MGKINIVSILDICLMIDILKGKIYSRTWTKSNGFPMIDINQSKKNEIDINTHDSSTDLKLNFLTEKNLSVACGSPDKKRINFFHGTATLAFRFQGGVIVCVDSRASMGSYIGSGTVKKIIEINPFLLGTMAGGAADCQFWERQLGVLCRLYELENGELISVKAAAKILSNMVSRYKGKGLSMGTMITGWDKKGPQLWYVDDEGLHLSGKILCVGSGGTFAMGVLDNYWKWNITINEAKKIAIQAILHATHRDAASGGNINLYHIKKGGWQFIKRIDCFSIVDHYDLPRKIPSRCKK